jgi:hypothetical protein
MMVTTKALFQQAYGRYAMVPITLKISNRPWDCFAAILRQSPIHCAIGKRRSCLYA